MERAGNLLLQARDNLPTGTAGSTACRVSTVLRLNAAPLLSGWWFEGTGW
jgi:hypothetical protein